MGDQVRSVPGPVPGSAPWPPAGQPRPSYAWMWWLGGCGSLGCVVLVALALATVFFGGNVLFDRVVTNALVCLPGDFPRYPGSTVLSYQSTLNWPKPGGTCLMTFVSGDSESRVYSFYEGRLNTGNWQVSADVPSGDASGGQITFQDRHIATTHGLVLVGPYGGEQEPL